MEPHRPRDVLDPGIAGDHLQVDLPHARELHVAGHGADAHVADPLRGHVARHGSDIEAASAGKLHAELPTAQRTAAAEGGLDAIAEGIQSDVLGGGVAQRHRDLALLGRDHLDFARLRAHLERDRTFDLKGRAPAAPRPGGCVLFVGLGVVFADAHPGKSDGALLVQLVDLHVAAVVLVRLDVVVHLVVVVLLVIDVAVVRHGAREKLRQVDLDPGQVDLRQLGEAGNARHLDVQAAVDAMASRGLAFVVLSRRLRQDRACQKKHDDERSDHGFASSDSCTTSRSERRYPAYPSSTRMRTFTSSLATARDSPSCALARVSVSSQRRASSGSRRGLNRSYSASSTLAASR